MDSGGGVTRVSLLFQLRCIMYEYGIIYKDTGPNDILGKTALVSRSRKKFVFFVYIINGYIEQLI